MFVLTLGPSAMFGPQAAFFAEQFGTRVRYTGVSLGFQLGAVLAGGLSPVIAASLAAAAGDLSTVSLFIIAMAVISLACALAMRKPAMAERSGYACFLDIEGEVCPKFRWYRSA